MIKFLYAPERPEQGDYVPKHYARGRINHRCINSYYISAMQPGGYDTQSVFVGRVSWSLRVMTDIERRLSSFSIPLIGDAPLHTSALGRY